MKRAIATTIELSCTTYHSGIPRNNDFRINTSGSDNYRQFWKGLIDWVKKGNKFPIIISFNYDLVLERSLFQTFIGTSLNIKSKLPFNGIILNYSYDLIPQAKFWIKYTSYEDDFESSGKSGTFIEPVRQDETNTGNFQEITILKLHGSLNFPTKNDSTIKITSNTDDPYIIPPISNKFFSKEGDSIWRTGLNALRVAKNVIFIGYSLPKTDIYMQYFLKAGLGPNRDINKIFVYNPILHLEEKEGMEMRDRYQSCFAEQMRNRIIFQHRNISGGAGTLSAFIGALSNSPSEVLF